jgi:glycerol kinase
VRALAIDQGTSATKAVVVDPERGLLAEVDVPVSGLRYDGDAVEQDPLALWQSVVDAGQQALQSLGVTAAGIDVVGVGNQGETVLAWNRRSGEPLTPAIVWQDRRARAVTDRLAEHGAWLHELTGLPLDPYFAAAKMTWLAEHRLDAAQRSDPDVVVTTIDAWVNHRLTGAFVSDVATASRTQLLDLASASWSPRATDCFGIAEHWLPHLVSCDEQVGTTSAFGVEVPVAGLVVDQQAALYAEGCHSAGDAKCTYGTGAFLLAALGTTPAVSGRGLATSVAWRTGDDGATYCVDGQVYTVGAAVRWLQRIGLLASAAELDAVAGDVADSAGVQFVPSLAGVGAPDWRPDAKGAFTGLSLGTERAHLVRAVAEGIAAQVATLVEVIGDDLALPLTTLRVDGGLTRSTTVMQAQADLLQRPVTLFPQPCATALGVAALALRSSDDVTVRRAADALTTDWHPVQTYEPQMRADEAADRLAAWRTAYDLTLADPPR